ncbi:hypothetical protein [Streptomyces sp. AC627_RSS907]|uniref:hypothetical protein n=1 Tax=Streptomyces sp. AC627_RSS907 TaxID=2823684 RepID=UPI001C2315A1|nr:hypothetical protein [Streptomyces sp. AC627_RSS907]
MGTKTVDETGLKTDEDKTDEATGATEAPGTDEKAVTGTPDGADATNADAEDAAADDLARGAAGTEGPTGVGQGAGAVVSAGLGIVSLTGSWVGTVASAREAVFGQLETTQSSNVQTMLEKGYGDAWQATALWGGVFALVALIVGVVVLVRPAFGAPGKPQAAWIKSVSWAGVALGVIGLILAVLKYTDVMLAVPSAG